MTDRSTRGAADGHTIQLLVQGDSDRTALAALLDERYALVDGDAPRPADCYLIGDRMVPAQRRELRALKREADPTFRPVLLLRRADSHGTVPLPSEQTDGGPPLIDEVVSAPVDRATLFRRLANLLARREQSLELSARYEHVKTRFQRLFDSTNDAIFVVTPAGDEITECNPAAADLLGYTRAELRSLSPLETIHADERERFRSLLSAVKDTGHRTIDDLTCQTKAGETRRLEVSAATLDDADGSPLVLSARDVTERKAYERELELKSRAMDEAPVGITITDPDRPDNPMTYVNDGFTTLTGYPAEEVRGRNCRFLQGEATREEQIDRMREAIDAAEPVSVELRNYRKDGSLFWNRVSIAPVRDDAGTVTNYVGFQQDVTERKEREQDLQLFRKAVENAAHAVYITDREGTIEYVNPAFEAQTGYTRDEAVGRSLHIIDSGKQDAAFYDRMWDTVLGGERWEATLINQRNNGELYHVDQTISPITNGSGAITHLVTIEADVTNRRLREQQVDVLNRVLRHNLRNGMNVVQGLAERLSETLADDELRATATAIEDRADAVARLGEKAQTVRSLFDAGSPTETACDLRGLLCDVVEECSDAHAGASVTLADGDPVRVRADSRLKLAVRELVDNAIVHNDRAVPAVTVGAAPAGNRATADWIEIEITDNGPGIPDQELQTIERGEETSLTHGTGLGLWVVYWTVSLFGGEVSIEDTSPRGTRVVLSLPRATGDAPTRSEATDHH